MKIEVTDLKVDKHKSFSTGTDMASATFNHVLETGPTMYSINRAIAYALEEENTFQDNQQ